MPICVECRIKKPIKSFYKSLHERDEFSETKTPRKVDELKLAIMTKANEIADEFVTPMRLEHVLDAFPDAGIEKTGDIIKAMIEDVTREGKGEIVDSKETRGAIGKKTAMLFKKRLNEKISRP